MPSCLTGSVNKPCGKPWGLSFFAWGCYGLTVIPKAGWERQLGLCAVLQVGLCLWCLCGASVAWHITAKHAWLVGGPGAW